MYKRDSLYLAYTVSKFHDSDVVGYGIGYDRIDIDTIVYSPDTLKFITFVIDSFLDYFPKVPDTAYGGGAMLGYRLRTSDPWMVYPFTAYSFLGYHNYNMVRDRLRTAYFREFKNRDLLYWNNVSKDFERYFSYNVTDPKFWDSSIIWKKDVSIPGCYQFQLSGNGNPEITDRILNVPKIKYPDSLLMQYR